MNWTERKITPVQALNWCCCATALAKAAQLHLQWISCIFSPCLCCPVCAWCSNTLPTLVLTAGGSWASFPPPLPYPGHFTDRIWTLLLFWPARTVIFEPFFPSTGGKMVLNVVPCCNVNGKGNSHVYFIPLSQRAAPNISIGSASIRMCRFTLGTAPTHPHVHAVFVFVYNIYI